MDFLYWLRTTRTGTFWNVLLCSGQCGPGAATMASCWTVIQLMVSPQANAVWSFHISMPCGAIFEDPLKVRWPYVPALLLGLPYSCLYLCSCWCCGWLQTLSSFFCVAGVKKLWLPKSRCGWLLKYTAVSSFPSVFFIFYVGTSLCCWFMWLLSLDWLLQWR